MDSIHLFISAKHPEAGGNLTNPDASVRQNNYLLRISLFQEIHVDFKDLSCRLMQ